MASHLECHRVGDDQEEPQGQPSFVTSVTPQAMGSCCDAQGTNQIVEKRCQEKTGQGVINLGKHSHDVLLRSESVCSLASE